MSISKSITYSYSFLYRIHPKYTLTYVILSFVATALSIYEIIATKNLIQGIENWSTTDIYHIVVLLAIVTGILYLNGLSGMLKAISMTNLNEVELSEKERLILAKTTNLNISDIESPQIMDKRRLAYNYSPYNNFINGIDFINFILLSVVLFFMITYFGHWLISIGLLAVFIFQLKMHSVSSSYLYRLNVSQTSLKRMLDYFFNILTDKQYAKEVRLFRISEYIKGKWNHKFSTLLNDLLRVTIRGEMVKVTPDLIIALINGIIALTLILIVNRKGLSIAQFNMLFQVSIMLIKGMTSSSQLFGQLKAHYLKQRDFTLYQQLPEDPHRYHEDMVATEVPEESHASLRVENLTFSYPDAKKNAIKDVSFEIYQGQHVALVGENGSGKTTLIKLLLGYYEPNQGSIKWAVDGLNRSIGDLRRKTSAVFQDFFKYETTVAENIAFSNLNKINERDLLTGALARAEAKEFIQGTEEKLGTKFGGRDLSGGQWQKIATARAYFRESSCLIFDEPTAALDPKAEMDTIRRFFEIAKNRTAIIVTHRLAAARYADIILVFNNGRLVESGNHQELLIKKGEYQRLYTLQSAWYK